MKVLPFLGYFTISLLFSLFLWAGVEWIMLDADNIANRVSGIVVCLLSISMGVGANIILYYLLNKY